MGHITRDIAIAMEIHKQNPEVEILWLASPLASRVLKEAGEKLLPESTLSADYNSVSEKAMDGFKLNLMKYVFFARQSWIHNAKLFKQVIDKL